MDDSAASPTSGPFPAWAGDELEHEPCLQLRFHDFAVQANPLHAPDWWDNEFYLTEENGDDLPLITQSFQQMEAALRSNAVSNDGGTRLLDDWLFFSRLFAEEDRDWIWDYPQLYLVALRNGDYDTINKQILLYQKYLNRRCAAVEELRDTYGEVPFVLLNGNPCDTGGTSGYLSAVVRQRAVYERLDIPPEPERPTPIPGPDEANSPDPQEYRRKYESEYLPLVREYEEKVAEYRELIRQLTERVSNLQNSFRGPGDQCAVLYPPEAVLMESTTLTPIKVCIRRGFIEYALRRFPDAFARLSPPEWEGKTVETYAYNDFVYLVEANALTVREVAAEIIDDQQRRDRKLHSVFSTPESEDNSNPRRAIPDQVRREVWRRDEGKCQKCGSRVNLEFDHIIPVSRGGSSTARNIQLLCEHCNRSKGAHLA